MTTQSEGLSAEIRHLEVLLKDQQEFKSLFEADNSKLRVEYADLLEKHNVISQELSGFHAILATQKERMENLKAEYDRVNIENKELLDGKESIVVELDKMTEFYRATKSDLEGTIDRLH